MALTRWEPTMGMRSLRDQINRMFEDVMGTSLNLGMPAVDVYQRDHEMVVEAELPGLDLKDVEVNATEDSITIRGQSRFEREVKEENLLRSERRLGMVNRTIDLPTPIKPEETRASFRNGVLTIHAPLAEGVKPRKVQISEEG
ncbi:Spore protein SP21 [compost metagenome]